MGTFGGKRIQDVQSVRCQSIQVKLGLLIAGLGAGAVGHGQWRRGRQIEYKLT
eukprot:CAMPEP_0204438970 /NCGR_PEP_ID=MMETSP0470-20130426/80459_1 /ASSEMBLY_ACC=CAM_ASM_000385 /TAXON_ID=2969 /ORGANISM="Oxyrrhis marina" /LENGTH=52 /DNA_ID=CAMNT_0051437845 /DNA_START=23 /DNA_END=177 /DNA_ORIENTATION=+